MAILLKEAVQSIDVVAVIINKDEQKFADELLKIVLQRAEKYEDMAGEIVNIQF